MSFLRTDVYALREERSTATMFYEHAKQPLSEQARADAEKLLQVASAVVKDTSLFGAWSIADSELAFCLQRLGLNGHDLGPLRQFAAAQWERPSVRKYVQHPRASYVPY
jgi:glutathione S-transferase